MRPCEACFEPKDGRKGSWLSFLFKIRAASAAFHVLLVLPLGQAPKFQDSALPLTSGLLPEPILFSACFPFSSARIGVIVDTPLDVLVGCGRPALQQC